jgi:hypothetical protein
MSDQLIGVYKALYREVEVKQSVTAIAKNGSGELEEWKLSNNKIMTCISTSLFWTAAH